MVCKNRIAHGDVASDSLVETTVGKDAERGCQVLLAIDALSLEGLELWIRSYPQVLARRGLAKGAGLLILCRVLVKDGKCWSHGRRGTGLVRC